MALERVSTSQGEQTIRSTPLTATDTTVEENLKSLE